ncbi:hypothetical protein [Rossellomorea marisflavi]|uniref:hypothetical protein n=1 Tax=Rossellomorea marisflavi TaxID=189381 RepID=UPI00345C6D00
MAIERAKGEKYRPIVTVAKERHGLPTKVVIGGREYALLPEKAPEGTKPLRNNKRRFHK